LPLGGSAKLNFELHRAIEGVAGKLADHLQAELAKTRRPVLNPQATKETSHIIDLRSGSSV